MTDYITPAELRDYIGSETTNFAALAQRTCTVTSATINGMCGRYFYQDAALSAKVFDPDDAYCTKVKDISTTTGLIVATDDAADGTYSTTWTLDTDYFLEPANQEQGGITGWPYTKITSLATRVFWKRTSAYRRPLVKVTAKWGWAAVPDPVKHACLEGAAQRFKMKDAADGFIGLDGWGPVRVRENPDVQALLGPYMKDRVVMA